MPRHRKYDVASTVVERANRATSYRELAKTLRAGHSRDRLLKMAAQLDAESSKENGEADIQRL